MQLSEFTPESIHADLGEDFFDVVDAAEFPKAILRYRNDRAAQSVGLDGLTDGQWIDHFGHFKPIEGSFETPLALRYHGHQFRSYNPDLGDGRGFLFAQMRERKSRRLLDFGTKGSGRTPWSRQGDGRLTLKGGVREILATEMLEALGVNTSRTFSIVETGEALYRGDEPSPTRSAVMVRLSHGHIRIGSFQRQAALKRSDNIEKLLRHSMRYYQPALWEENKDKPTGDMALAFLREVSRNVARTGAQWIAAGFVHGVLNTDNINITGESFDYGPWRFLPHYDPAFTAAYFDQTGLYSYGRQPETLMWNLARLAETLIDFCEVKDLEEAVGTFWPAFQTDLNDSIMRRFGLVAESEAVATEFVRAWINFMGASEAPFEQVFFDLRGGDVNKSRRTRSIAAEHYGHEKFAALQELLDNALSPAPDANLEHAYFQRNKPRTMLIDEVEAIWAPIAENDDWSLFDNALEEIAEMRAAYGLAT